MASVSGENGGKGGLPPGPALSPPGPTPSPSANLNNSVIALSTLREYGRKELIDVLDSVRGKKGLVLDPKFSGPLGLVAEVSLLKEHGVEKIYHVTPGKIQTECKNLIYLVRPKVHLMKMIGEHIRGHIEEGQKKEYFVFFAPRRTMICERVLEEEGVYSEITFGEYHLDLIPFDDDLLSLELETSYKECFLEGDRTSLFYVARSLMKLQSVFGVIPNLKGKGYCSKLVIDMLVRMRREMGGDEGSLSPEIEELILIDRQVDMITPMCTQLTYEGLIDEVFGINNSYVDVENEIVGQNNKGAPTQQPNKKVKVPLNSNDKLYFQLRDLNFSVLLPLLNKKAKEIDEYYKQRHGAETLSQMRDFMKRFAAAQQEHTSLRIHTGIAEKILAVTKDPLFHKQLEAEQNLLAGIDLANDYVEEAINRQEPLVKVLRLLVLQSLTNNGIKPKQYEFFKREILQTYGYECLFTLNNLEKLGLFKRQEGKNNFVTLRKSLQLVMEEINENNPTDIAYVFSGYAPLSVRLLQCAIKPGGWRSREDILKLVPGPTVEEVQAIPGALYRADSNTSATRKPVTLVFFIGGITFAEIAALRWLSQQEGQYRDIIIATTKLINGNTILSSLMENLTQQTPSTN